MAASMIQVSYGTTVSHFKKNIPSDTKIGDFAREHELLQPGSTLTFNGSPVDNMDKTFEELLPAGANTCMLYSVVNAKNA